MTQPITTSPDEPPEEFDGLPVFISVPHAARLLGLTRASAYRLASTGELPARRLGGRVYVISRYLSRLATASDTVGGEAK